MKPYSVDKFAQQVLHGEKVFVLDVRKEEDVEDWKIEGSSVEFVNIPFEEVENDVKGVKEKLPTDKKIITVCYRGVSSQEAAKLLQEEGLQDITYLENGMAGWSEHLEPVKVGDLSDGGEIYQFIRLGKGCLSYMIVSDGEAAVVDANRMIGAYKKFAEEKNLNIKHVIDSHLHADHISGGRLLADDNAATYWFPPKDDEGMKLPFEVLIEDVEIEFGNQKVKVLPLYSPGHTKGSTSFIVDDAYLLTGDILFVESIGRPDLAGKADEWVNDLYTTLHERYTSLTDQLYVLPGHFGKMNEINKEKHVGAKMKDIYKQNEQLKVTDKDEFHHMVTDNLPPQPNSHQEIRKTNLGKQKVDEEEKREMELGPNRCAVS
ncbi:MBL fold metallo-hydrolase [Bacillus tianshenii]|nr:MBL fold metallo-hydrolase [Bacillus tianshenii]